MSEVSLEEARAVFLTYCRSRGLAPTTVATYAWALEGLAEYVGRLPGQPALPDAHTLRAYVISLQERGLSPASVSIATRAVRTFFRFLVRDGLIAHDPTAAVPTPKVPLQYPRVLGTDEVQRLLRTCTGSSWASIRNRAILVTFLDTGVRLGELVNLNAEDVDTRTGTIRIRNGKGGKDRQVFLGRAAHRDVRRWFVRRGPWPADGPCFCCRDGRRLRRRSVQRIVEQLGQKAGLAVKLTPHMLRHTFATEFIRNGGDVFSLQRILGHSAIETTMVYVHMAGRGLQEAHARASPVDGLLGRS